MSENLVSVCVPTLGRPESLARLLRMISANAEWPHEVIVRWDRPIPQNRGCPTVLHECYQAAKGNVIAYLGNDCLPQPGFLRIAMECMQKHFPNMDGCVATNDGYWHGELPLHFLIGRPLVEKLGGYVFFPGYSHCCCDSELGERCRQLNKYIWCEEAQVWHDHPINGGMRPEDMDDVYRSAYEPTRRQADCDLLLKRATEFGFPIRSNFRRPLIPRRVFAIWLGDAPMPELVKRCMASQREFTKGYHYNLVTEPTDHPYVREAIAARKWVKAVDYMKLQLLHDHGGIYMDLDVELVKPFPDEFLADRLFAGRERNGWIGNGVIGAEPGHPILKACLERVEREFRGDDDKNFESSVQVFTETVHRMGIDEHGVKIYEPSVFTPYDHQAKQEERTENTVACHHFMVSWGYPNVPPVIDLRPRLAFFGDISQMKVLNIGLGRSDSGLGIQLPALNFKRIDHIEVHQPYIDIARDRFWVAKEVHYSLDDVRYVPAFDFSSYDLIMAFDVLEHLTMEEAREVLRRIEEFGTPLLAFVPLEETLQNDRPGEDMHVESQWHRSLWTEQDFIDLGFQTERLPGWEALWAVRRADKKGAE